MGGIRDFRTLRIIKGEEMNTTADFENAKVGRTAKGAKGVRAIKTFNVNAPWSVFTEIGAFLCFNTNNDMEFGEFVLDEPGGLTAREHFGLGWEKAYPVLEGQNIPIGTEYVEKIDEGQTIIATHDEGKWIVTEYGAERVRTLDPIKNPDWTSAPAVVAWVVWDGLCTEKAWVKAGDNWMSSDGEVVDWKDLRDVTPLYPKETN